MASDIRFYIRRMQEEDLEAVTALEASCFSMPWKYNDFKEVLTNPHRFYLVAENEKKEIIGGCMLTEISGEGDISNVAVKEEYRNNNVASALMKKLISIGIQSCEINEFTLEVRSKNIPAMKLYDKLGFKSVGIRPNFYDKPKDDAIIKKLYVD